MGSFGDEKQVDKRNVCMPAVEANGDGVETHAGWMELKRNKKE